MLINSTIQEAIESLPNTFAFNRFTDSILNLKEPSKFMEDTTNKTLIKKINNKLGFNIIDGQIKNLVLLQMIELHEYIFDCTHY